MADTGDLKSPELRSCGFESHQAHQAHVGLFSILFPFWLMERHLAVWKDTHFIINSIKSKRNNL